MSSNSPALDALNKLVEVVKAGSEVVPHNLPDLVYGICLLMIHLILKDKYHFGYWLCDKCEFFNDDIFDHEECRHCHRDRPYKYR